MSITASGQALAPWHIDDCHIGKHLTATTATTATAATDAEADADVVACRAAFDDSRDR